MVKIEQLFSKFLLAFCIFLAACSANSQPEPSKEVQSEIVNTAESKQKLAKYVLSEIGIAEQYDLYLGNIVEAVSPSTNPKFNTWLQGVFVREAGWKHVESKYIAVLEANFSEAELKQLLTLSKQPVMKKLRQAEVQAYTDASEERRKLLEKVWYDYNSGKINIPPEVLQ